MAQVAHAFFHPVETPLDLLEAAIDLIKALLCLRLESEQVLVDALDLLREKSKRAFELAHPALEIANLCLDIHGHGTLYHNGNCVRSNDCGRRRICLGHCDAPL